ncbi:5981_t:CDS:2 [Entrophospora sp. SA101]|nr:5981_t:CDS:2 [Entrophospora sp. SA101]
MEGTSSRFGSKKERKLVTLTNIQKKELCEYKIANSSKTDEEIGNKFGISKSTVGIIISNEEKWLAITVSSAATKRDCGGTGLC